MRWWKQWLLEEDTGIMDEPMLRLFVGKDFKPHPRYPEIGGRWIGVPGWPSEGAAQRFQLDDRSLTLAPPVAIAPVRVDTPQHLGAQAGEWCPLDGGGDGPEFQGDNRADDGLSVCFDTPVLAAPVEVVGFPRLALDLAMDGDTATIIIRLNEIAADGTSGRVTFAIRRITRPAGVAAGERFSAEIPLKAVAYEFSAGTRIRLALSSTYWPMVWPEHDRGGITLYPEATVFSLPGMPETAVHDLPDLGPPSSAMAIPSEVLVPGDILRSSTWHATTGEVTLTSRSQRQTYRLGELTLGGQGGHGYSILPGDGSSAKAFFESVQLYDRPGWSVRLASRTDIGWEDGKLRLTASYEAFEGEERVFYREWRESFDY
jgi:predicted acyl esterase